MGRILESLVGDLRYGSGANFKNRLLIPGKTAALLGAAVLAWNSGGSILGNAASENEKATEDCVAALVGKSVNLVQVKEGGALQIPASVMQEQIACMKNANNPVSAAVELGTRPIANNLDR